MIPAGHWRAFSIDRWFEKVAAEQDTWCSTEIRDRNGFWVCRKCKRSAYGKKLPHRGTCPNAELPNRLGKGKGILYVYGILEQGSLNPNISPFPLNSIFRLPSFSGGSQIDFKAERVSIDENYHVKQSDVPYSDVDEDGDPKPKLSIRIPIIPSEKEERISRPVPLTPRKAVSTTQKTSKAASTLLAPARSKPFKCSAMRYFD